MTLSCAFVFKEGHKCSSLPDEHVHQPAATCKNGPDGAARHHEYVAPKPHQHVFDRCICGAQAVA